MKSSTPCAALHVAAVQFALASGQAFSPVSTSTGAGANSTAMSSVLAGICPGYDGKNFTDGNSVAYLVHCDAYAASANEYLVTNPSSVATAPDCMKACDEFEGCEGAVYYAGDRCVLTTGTTFGRQQNSSGVAYFIRQDVPATASSAASTLSNMASTASSVGTSSSASFPSAVPQSCNASNIQCPACNGATVTDYNGISYEVYCDYKLNASSSYDVQAYTSASGCLLHCDDYSWCLGATFWTGGNCQLARSGASEIQIAGYTAFVPVAGAYQTADSSPVVPSSTGPVFNSATSSTPPSYTNSVAYTSGTTFIPDGSKSTSQRVSTGSATIVAPTATSSAANNATTLSASCPASDGLNVTDVVDQDYTVTCEYEPVCESTVDGTRAYYTQETCLESCDQDAICLAATWNDGSCQLCEGSLEGLTDYEYGSGDVIFLIRPLAEDLNQPVSALGDPSVGATTYSSASAPVQPTPYATVGAVSRALAPHYAQSRRRLPPGASHSQRQASTFRRRPPHR